MIFRRISFVIFIVLVWVGTVVATSLDDYHKRLDAARMDVIALRRLEDESQSFSRLRNQKLNDIYKSIPKSEQLEWQGGSMEVNNQWLYDGLTSYLDEHDDGKRRTALLGIEERLSAVGEKIDELEKATAAERSKDDDKQKLAEILRREEYQKPEVQEKSLFQKWWDAFWKWLQDLFSTQPITPQGAPDLSSLKILIQILIFAAVIGLIGFLIYRFLPFLGGRFGYKPKKKKRDRVILGERIAEDESANDLFDEAERLAREGLLRDAIRKGYIAVLCELSDRKIIGLARHKTNRDYLRDVRKRSGLFENMSGLTGTYEQNWYGLRPSQPNDWEDFRSRYKETMASANL